jgi:rhodanese-related sulfurtransferase
MQLITREELKATLDANHDSKLVMVVGPWEFRARHIPGSLGFPSPRSALAALDRDDQIILYANNHHRINTTSAAHALDAHGYRNVRCHPGGLADWEAAGYPVEGDTSALAPTAAGPMGTAPRGENCKAAAPTATTAGPGTAGHPHQPPPFLPQVARNLPIPSQLPSRALSGWNGEQCHNGLSCSICVQADAVHVASQALQPAVVGARRSGLVSPWAKAAGSIDRRGNGLEYTTLVVTPPRPLTRPATSSRWPMDRATTLRTKQSSPVTWCASMISGVVASSRSKGA